MGAGVEHWNDMTSMADISVSSRPSMLPSLTDGSTGYTFTYLIQSSFTSIQNII